MLPVQNHPNQRSGCSRSGHQHHQHIRQLQHQMAADSRLAPVGKQGNDHYFSIEVFGFQKETHWIVDLVDTGNTLKANGLIERETVLQCGAVLVANRASQKLKLDAYLDLMERLER